MEPVNIVSILSILALAVIVVVVLRHYMRRRTHPPQPGTDVPAARRDLPSPPITAEDEEYLDSSHIISTPRSQHPDKPR